MTSAVRVGTAGDAAAPPSKFFGKNRFWKISLDLAKLKRKLNKIEVKFGKK